VSGMGEHGMANRLWKLAGERRRMAERREAMEKVIGDMVAQTVDVSSCQDLAHPRRMMVRKPSEDYIEDGFGGAYPLCGREDCALEIVRPGKTQCSCEEEGEPDPAD
jgi:hypothetical protein